jgi:hypothetical protein
MEVKSFDRAEFKSEPERTFTALIASFDVIRVEILSNAALFFGA